MVRLPYNFYHVNCLSHGLKTKIRYPAMVYEKKETYNSSRDKLNSDIPFF